MKTEDQNENCGFVFVRPHTVYSKYFFFNDVNTLMLLLWSKNVSALCDETLTNIKNILYQSQRMLQIYA
jgi:hypothetical protein